MLLGITAFEIRYQLKNPVFWVAIAILFLLGLGGPLELHRLGRRRRHPGKEQLLVQAAAREEYRRVNAKAAKEAKAAKAVEKKAAKKKAAKKR